MVYYLQADAGVLQFQNQQLVQQIDIQKYVLHDLQEKKLENQKECKVPITTC